MQELKHRRPRLKFSRTVIPATNVVSLTWCGDSLIDWVCGGTVFYLDGTRKKANVSWAFPFDAACATKGGHFAVIYQRLGTKALLLRDGKFLRELDRSFYHAHVYEYPVCIWQSASRTLLAHCPEEYCRIDIDDAESGARLTRGNRKPSDFFHSRLMVDNTGTRLLSAGWIWHPWDSVVTFDIAEALSNPTVLDNLRGCAPASRHLSMAEESSACWQTPERLLLGASTEQEDLTDKDAVLIGEPRLHPGGIAVYDLVSQTYTQSVTLGEPPGTMMPLRQSHVVCFYRHPKLVSLDSGEVVLRWEDLDTGNQVSSISESARVPPLALDAENQRFAVFGPAGITVIQFE
jgi:hypothetical protein